LFGEAVLRPHISLGLLPLARREASLPALAARFVILALSLPAAREPFLQTW